MGDRFISQVTRTGISSRLPESYPRVKRAGMPLFGAGLSNYGQVDVREGHFTRLLAKLL